VIMADVIRFRLMSKRLTTFFHITVTHLVEYYCWILTRVCACDLDISLAPGDMHLRWTQFVMR